MLLIGLYILLIKPLYSEPKVRRDYRININNLFDQDEQFLYENDHFKCLLRRLITRHNNLVNTAFNIDDNIMEEDKDIDDFYRDFDNLESSAK